MVIKRPSIHKITPDIKNASIYFRGQPKWGKSQTFRDVVLEKFGDPERGLMIKCGAESGDTMLDEINSVQVESWEEVVELATWLINEKGKEHQIEMISFDTVDELIKMAEKEAMRISFIESRETGKPLKPRSINQAFGGFGKGHKYTVDALLTPLIGKLKLHFGVWCIAHTKMKINTNNVDSLNPEMAVQQLTSNLDSRYEACFSGLLDIIVTGAFENQEIVGSAEKNDKDVSLVDPTKQTRRLYFRSTPFVEAGGRISDHANIPESMIYESNSNNAKKFIEIIELGMERSKLSHRQHNNTEKLQKGTGNLSDKTEILTETMSNSELLDEVKKLYKECLDKEVKAQIRKVSGGAINQDTPVEVLQKILVILNQQ